MEQKQEHEKRFDNSNECIAFKMDNDCFVATAMNGNDGASTPLLVLQERV